MKKSILQNAHLVLSNLAGSDLIEADLTNADLADANLTNANLTNADLADANLTNANLTNADLADANLTNANLTNADLADANLTNANLTNADLADAKLAGTILPPLNNVRRFEFLKKTKIITWENLNLRSQSEVKIAEELDKRDLLFFPNSAARLTTKEGRKNKEPDFLICYKTTKGFKWEIIEVDSPYHQPKRRVEEQEREMDFERNGVIIYRFDSKKCYTEPDQVVDEFLELLENQNSYLSNN
ncbi:MAG: pentapeptide repeat-containing protein [Okeania sp. SIO2F4]|nr:pentapeptide repeat-containing protein [Okeania sp. SIO2F4]NES02679.1 pentapeptide repeat-containing protein [Okeania sp. SIO2F4]